jgi:hypothetical protein
VLKRFLERRRGEELLWQKQSEKGKKRALSRRKESANFLKQ